MLPLISDLLSKNTKIQQFSQRVQIADLTLYSKAFFIELDDIFLSGSAAHTLENHQLEQRAWSEFLERYTIMYSKISPKDYREISSEVQIRHDELFKTSTSDKMQYAQSNGMAAHYDINKAINSAKFEVIERHILLKSWIGELCPKQIHFETEQAKALEGIYKTSWYCFNINHSTPVAGLFLHPVASNKPLVYGFGCAGSLNEACIKAQSEALQRLCFLWDEEIPQTLNFSPTPDFHQDFYLQSKNHGIINKFLSGGFFKENKTKEVQLDKILVYDLTPPIFTETKVVKAFNSELQPLTFGHLNIVNLSPEQLIHLIA